MELGAQGSIASAFVRKLYRILDQECAQIIAWDIDGLSFTIFDSVLLNERVLPKYFRGRLTAFRQQLTGHGFTRMPRGAQAESYTHPHFRRGCPGTVNLINRRRAPPARPQEKLQPPTLDSQPLEASLQTPTNKKRHMEPSVRIPLLELSDPAVATMSPVNNKRRRVDRQWGLLENDALVDHALEAIKNTDDSLDAILDMSCDSLIAPASYINTSTLDQLTCEPTPSSVEETDRLCWDLLSASPEPLFQAEDKPSTSPSPVTNAGSEWTLANYSPEIADLAPQFSDDMLEAMVCLLGEATNNASEAQL
ncbi:TPA: hypothetical protein N0F65_007452 [Lagenidium giganteum]|uniref:HSF-type DNA-binding domain-containing protein n=1 Tax=Lagenidium giganteum TaxID=4803 RepID=A0AAV2ZIE0_9STRA|nr:TPA: hypothetical protein N0F65_007452 [Lagenidium giganteum]